MEIKKIMTNYQNHIFLKEVDSPRKIDSMPEMEVVNIYPDILHQEILGFGGAFTESSGYCFYQLSEEKKEQWLSDSFSSEGCSYNFCRLPIASCDFSLNSYSYLENSYLDRFNIHRDYKYIIPMVQSAQKINKELVFLASPWSPPAFMKSNQSLVLGGKLLKEYKQLYANYLTAYIKEYTKIGIPISYLTIQNEPNAIQTWESCLYDAEEESDFIRNYLYPTFLDNEISTNILIWDHNKEKLVTRAKKTFENEITYNIVAGIAFHWYTGDHFENIRLLRQYYPDKVLIHTEGCTGYSNFNPKEEIQNAEIYGHDIINDLEAGVSGFCDWNLLLDHQGGPNHKNNFCNSPSMLTNTKNNYIKNLTYYYIAHFSKYIERGSKKIGMSRYTDKIEVVAFKNKKNHVMIIVLNRQNTEIEYNVCIESTVFHDTIPSHSIITYQLIN